MKIKLAGLGLALKDSPPGFALPSSVESYGEDEFPDDQDYAEQRSGETWKMTKRTAGHDQTSCESHRISEGR